MADYDMFKYKVYWTDISPYGYPENITIGVYNTEREALEVVAEMDSQGIDAYIEEVARGWYM